MRRGLTETLAGMRFWSSCLRSLLVAVDKRVLVGGHEPQLAL
jgi:hypothetical protein